MAEVSFGSPKTFASPLLKSVQAAAAEAAAPPTARGWGWNPQASAGGAPQPPPRAQQAPPAPRAKQAPPVHRIPAETRASAGKALQAATRRQPSPVVLHHAVHGAGATLRTASPVLGQAADGGAAFGGTVPRTAPQLAAGAPAPAANYYSPCRDRPAACETGTGAALSREDTL